MTKGRVGLKGELFLPKETRERLALLAHVKVIYEIEGGRLVVEPVATLQEVLREPPCVEIAFDEFHKLRKELSRKAES